MADERPQRPEPAEEEPEGPEAPEDYWNVPGEGDGEAEGEPTVPELIDVLRKGDPRACERAVEQLAAIGDPALPLLHEAMKDESPDVRVDAAKAIKQITGLDPM